MPDPILDAIDARIAAAVAPVLARVVALEQARDGDRPPFHEGPWPAPPPVVVPPVVPPASAHDPRRLAMGINVERARYWSPSWPFNDLVKTSGGGATGVPWMGSQVALDADGYPLGLKPGESVNTVLVDGSHYPTGPYTITWDGDGALELGGTAYTASPAQAPILPGLGLKITRSNPTRPLKNLRIALPGGLFRDGFLTRLRPFGVLRFMDWANVNNTGLREWADRPTLTDRTWIDAVPYEVQIDLANALGANPWICTPRNASDAFARELGAMVAARLARGLTVYVEHWNEFWNKGQAPDTQPAAYGKRAAQVMEAFASGFGGRARTVRVLAGQAANPDVARQALVAAPAGSFDALAHAPYIGGGLGTRPEVAGWSVDQVIAMLTADVGTWKAKMIACHALARTHGLASIAYEGGQHLAGVGGLANDARMTALFTATNRDPRMEGVYMDYLKAWRETGGGLFCHFQDTGPYGKHGSWGAWEWHDQPDTPKARALLAAASAWRA